MNLGMFKDCVYHDAEIYNYKKDGNNIYFELREIWGIDTYKIYLKNVKIEVMNNEPEVVCYILDVLNRLVDNKKIWLNDGECGVLDKSIDGCKHYLKLWLHNKYDGEVRDKNVKYKFDGFDVSLCNDVDDTDGLFVKFLFDEIDVSLLNPMICLYDRMDEINIDNLYKYKDCLDEKVFNFFAAMNLFRYDFKNIEYANNNIFISYKNKLEPYDKISLKFNNVISDTEDELNKFIELVKKIGLDYDRIRFIEYSNNKYKLGFMKNYDDEIQFTCDSILYDGILIEMNSVLD